MSTAFLVTSLIVVASPGTGLREQGALSVETRRNGRSAAQVIVQAAFVALGAKLALAER